LLKKDTRLRGLERSVSKKVGRAIADYEMISDGDKILVALSGGKDSLALLRMLLVRQEFVPIKYELVPVYVDFGYQCSDITELKNYVSEQGLLLHVRRMEIFEEKPEELTCFWCSWNRRKALFQAALDLGCNKIAFGHHKDDIVQTILMNMLFEGQVSGMGPKQEMFGGKVFLIRPLAYVEEKETSDLAEFIGYPVSVCDCANGQVSKRAHVKKFINELETVCPPVKSNIFKSLQRIKKDYLL